MQAATNYQILPGDRVFVGTPQSPSVKPLPIGGSKQVPPNPYQSIPAGPDGSGEEQPIVSVAKIEIWERKKGQAKVVLTRPQIIFAIGQEAKAEVGNKESRLEVTVRSISDKKPVQHVIEATLIHDPEGKNPVTLMGPTLTLTDGETGSVIITGADGSEFGMEAGIFASDPRATLETPEKNSNRPAAKPKAFMNIGGR